jgi:hypothetical protein
LQPKELISIALDVMLEDNNYSMLSFPCDPPEEELEWAKDLILNRIEGLDLLPTEEELYTLMKLRMKV